MEPGRRRTIVFVLSGFGRHARGAERLVAALARELASRYEIRILGAGGEGVVPLRFVDRHDPITNGLNRLPGIGHVLRAAQRGPLNIEWKTCMDAAWRWLCEHPCDLLVPEGGYWGGRLGHRWRKRAGVPFVDIAHGAPSTWEVAAARWMPDAYVAATRVAADEMRARVPGLQTHVIPPGVDTAAFQPCGPRLELGLAAPVVLAVGALEPLKRMECVIEAVARWGRGSLLLVGDGPCRAALCSRGATLLGPGRFAWQTAEPHEMPAIYRAADVFVSASKSEAYGLVYLEAMASGLPVVTQDDAIRREVVGEAGWFCNADDAGALCAAIDAAWSAGGARSRPRALALDFANTARGYGELFSELLQKCS